MLTDLYLITGMTFSPRSCFMVLKSHLRTSLLPGLSSWSTRQLVSRGGVPPHFSHTSLLSLDLVQQHMETCPGHVEPPCGGVLWAEASQAVWCFSVKGRSWLGICREEGNHKIKRVFYHRRKVTLRLKGRRSTATMRNWTQMATSALGTSLGFAKASEWRSFILIIFH